MLLWPQNSNTIQHLFSRINICRDGPAWIMELQCTGGMTAKSHATLLSELMALKSIKKHAP